MKTETIAVREERHERLRQLDDLLFLIEDVQATLPINDTVPATFRLSLALGQLLRSKGFNTGHPLCGLHAEILDRQQEYMLEFEEPERLTSDRRFRFLVPAPRAKTSARSPSRP